MKQRGDDPPSFKVITKRGTPIQNVSLKARETRDRKGPSDPEVLFREFLDVVETEKIQLEAEVERLQKENAGYAVRVEQKNRDVEEWYTKCKKTEVLHASALEEIKRLNKELVLAQSQVYSLMTQQAKASEKPPEVEPVQTKLSASDLDFSCPVCMEDYVIEKLPGVWSCGHIICIPCSEGLGQCPVCRQEKTTVISGCPDYVRAVAIIKKYLT